MKDDEAWLLKTLYEEHKKLPEFKIEDWFAEFFRKETLPYKTARQLIEGQDKYNHKRLWYVMKKFYDKGIIEYGTSLGTAWLTDKGVEIAQNL